MSDPKRLLDAIHVLAEYGVENEGDLFAKVKWVRIEDGQILFNREYEIEPGEAVEMAILLLGYAKRLKKL